MKWIEDNITVDPSSTNRGVTISPEMVYRHRRNIDPRSRDIFAAASLRSMGVPAYLDPVTGRLHYLQPDGRDCEVVFPDSRTANDSDAIPAGTLVLDYATTGRIDDPGYYTHFSVATLAGGSLYWEDAHPYTEEFNGREYRFIFTASGGEVSYSYIYELDGSPASRTAAQTPADYSTDNGRDLAALRCDAGFEIEVFEGVYWVSASALGKTRFTNAQVYRLLSDTPEEKQAEISTLYEALQLYQIGDFRSADDNIRIEENGIDWEYHTPGRLAVENNRGCCATDSAWLRYILDGDYDELGYISTSQRDGSGHIYNYIRDGEWYYIIDLTHYRNDADIGLTTVIENGDIDSYMRSDRVLGNIHRTKDLRCFVNYVQDTFNDPPGLMFRLTCENVPPIDGVSTGNGIAITHPESYEPYITCIFDDPNDTLTHTYAPDPTRDPYK